MNKVEKSDMQMTFSHCKLGQGVARKQSGLLIEICAIVEDCVTKKSLGLPGARHTGN